MYKALVRPHLDYCDIIYHEPPLINQPPLGKSLTTLMDMAERVQYQAALAVTGAWQGSNRSKLYEELGWENLSDRRTSRRILQIHKISNDKTPYYLKDKLPINNRPLFGGQNRIIFHRFICRTNRYMNSFFPDAIMSWNIILEHFDNTPYFNKLKGHLISHFRLHKKSIFGIHDPLGIRYLFQLREGLSPLKSHKKRHNFFDTPSDMCNCKEGIEDTHHYLFSCPSYQNERAILTTSVNEIMEKNNLNHLENQLKLFLYVYESIGEPDNRNILLSTIKYIKDTQRFSN